MQLTMLKGKIHRATVVEARLDYVGSITIDSELLEAAGIMEYELVQIVDVENGNRFETYVIAGEPGSGMICLNGAAARMVQVNDKVIIMCYAQMTPEEAVKKATGQTPLVVGPGVKNGIRLKMDNPNTVGSDLVVDAVAAIEYYGAPVIIIDMGTATTISVVDAEGDYIGGMILPGIRCALESLITRTSQLPHIELERPKRLIGKNTIECMKSGMLYGNASCIDGMIDRIIDELGYDTPVVATGGLANLVIPMCRHEIIVDEELLLKGLDLIFQKNRSRYYVRK